jgi:transposase-like protein
MERRKLTREFKLEAVRLIKDRGVSYGQASQAASVAASRSGEEVHRRSMNRGGWLSMRAAPTLFLVASC